MGNILFEIAKERPDLTFILEDRPKVIEAAQEVSSPSSLFLNI